MLFTVVCLRFYEPLHSISLYYAMLRQARIDCLGRQQQGIGPVGRDRHAPQSSVQRYVLQGGVHRVKTVSSAPSRVVHQLSSQAVPPTVKPLMRMVGCPTPTGTL